jgi:hypothetical protein
MQYMQAFHRREEYQYHTSKKQYAHSAASLTLQHCSQNVEKPPSSGLHA